MLLIGGARSGKSALAVRIASAQAAPVVVIATAQPGDDEMALRIARHRRERPASWETIEEPVGLDEAIALVPGDCCLIVDCLTLWTANALAALGATPVEGAARAAATRASGRPGLTVTVTNEVGFGIVPDNPLSREYRDLLGCVNAMWADAAEHAFLVIAGRALALRPPNALIEEVR
jgi:adenosyl cobinamide kinase/adenosyl cobinamide phosphate guanylyltransferase